MDFRSYMKLGVCVAALGALVSSRTTLAEDISSSPGNYRIFGMDEFDQPVVAATPKTTETPAQWSNRMADYGNAIIEDLVRNSAFIRKNSDSLLARNAISRYANHKQTSLNDARTIKSTFYSSLALGGIAMTEAEKDPEQGEKLLMEAQEIALKINSYNMLDASSFPYLFEVIPMFRGEQGVRVLEKSKENLAKWNYPDREKSLSVTALARATIIVNPAGAEAYMNELTKLPEQQSYWYGTAIQLLARFKARQNPEWAVKQLDDFLKKRGAAWPEDENPLSGYMVEVASRDLAKTLAKFDKQLAADQQLIARVKLAYGLAADNRNVDANAVLEQLETRLKSLPTPEPWIRDMMSALRIQMDNTLFGIPDEVSQTWAKPGSQWLALIEWRARPMVFKSADDVRGFVMATLPKAMKIEDYGYDKTNKYKQGYTQSPRSATLGLVARLAAMTQDFESAEKALKQIKVPELQALFYIRAAEEVRPLNVELENWPIQFLPSRPIKIDPKDPNPFKVEIKSSSVEFKAKAKDEEDDVVSPGFGGTGAGGFLQPRN